MSEHKLRLYIAKLNASRKKSSTFSAVLDAAATEAFESAIPPATRNVLLGLLFISLAEEEGVEMLVHPLLALLIPLIADCNDDGTEICLPGEAKRVRQYDDNSYSNGKYC